MSDDESSSAAPPREKAKKDQHVSMQKLLEIIRMNEFDPGSRFRLESLMHKLTCTPCNGLPFFEKFEVSRELDSHTLRNYNELINNHVTWVLAIPRTVFVRDPCTFDELNPHFSVHGADNNFRCLMHFFLFIGQLCATKLQNPLSSRFYIEKVVFRDKQNSEDSKTEYAGWRWHLIMEKTTETFVLEVFLVFLRLNMTTRMYPGFLKGLMIPESLFALTNDKFLTVLSNYLLLNPDTQQLMESYRNIGVETIRQYLNLGNSTAVLAAYQNAYDRGTVNGDSVLSISTEQMVSARSFYPVYGTDYFPFPHLVWRIWQIDDFNYSRFLHSYFPDYTPVNAVTSEREFIEMIRRNGFATSDGCAIENVFQLSNLGNNEFLRAFPDETVRNAMLRNPLLPSQLVQFEAIEQEVRRIGKNTWIINQEAAFSWVTRYAKQSFNLYESNINELGRAAYAETRKLVWSAYKKYFDPHTERMAESQRSISEYINTVLSAPEFNQRHLATLIDPDILPTNLSYGNAWHAFEMCFYEEVLNSMYTHKATFLLFRASLVSTVNNAMNIHVLIPGSPATGKSFMLDCVRFNCLVPGTWYEFATATEKTETAFTAEMVQNRTLVYHEIPAGLIGIRDKNEAPSDREQLMKTLISEGEAMFSELKYDNSANKRNQSKKGFTPPDRDMYIRKIPGHLSVVGCLNDSFDKISDPIQTRFCVQYVQYQHRDDGKTFDEAVVSYSVDKDLQKARCHPFRLLQSLHFAIMYAIDSKLLPEVDTTVAMVYMLYMFRILKSLGFDTSKSRHASRFMQIIRCETIVEAVRKVFFSPVFQCMLTAHSISWDFAHLELVTPFLVATEDILFRCMGVYIQQYVDPIELLIIRLFRLGFFPNRMLYGDARETDRDFLAAERLQHWRPPNANEENYDYLVLPVRVVPEHHELAARLMLIENSPIKTVKSVFQKAIQSLMSRRIKSFDEHSCNILFGRRCEDRAINPSQLSFFKADHVFFEKLPNGSEARRERMAYVVHKSLLTLTGNRIVNDLIEGCFHYHIRTILRTPVLLLENASSTLLRQHETADWFRQENDRNNEMLVWDVALCFSLFLEQCYSDEVDRRVHRARIRRTEISEEIRARRNRNRRTSALIRDDSEGGIRSAINLNALNRNAFARASNASDQGSSSFHPARTRSVVSEQSASVEEDEREDDESWDEMDCDARNSELGEDMEAGPRGGIDINVMSIDEPGCSARNKTKETSFDTASTCHLSDVEYHRRVKEYYADASSEELKHDLKQLDTFLFAIRKRKTLPTSLLYQDVVARRKMTLREFLREPMSNARIQYQYVDAGCEEEVDLRNSYNRRQTKSWLLFPFSAHASRLPLRQWSHINTQVVEHFFDFVRRNETCCRLNHLSREQLGFILQELSNGVYMCDEPILGASAVSRVLPEQTLQSVTMDQGRGCITWMHVDVRFLQYVFRHRRFVVTGEQIPGQPHLCNLLPVLPRPFFLRMAASSVFDDHEMEDYMEQRRNGNTHEELARRLERRFHVSENTESFLAEQAEIFLDRSDEPRQAETSGVASTSASQPTGRPVLSVRSTTSPFDADVAMRLHGIRDSKLFVLVMWDLEGQVINKFLRKNDISDVLGFDSTTSRVLHDVYKACVAAATPWSFEDLLYTMRQKTEDVPRSDLYNKFSNVVYIKTANQQAYPFALLKNTSEGKLIHKIPMHEVHQSVPGSNIKREVFRGNKVSVLWQSQNALQQISHITSLAGLPGADTVSEFSLEDTLISMREMQGVPLDDSEDEPLVSETPAEVDQDENENEDENEDEESRVESYGSDDGAEDDMDDAGMGSAYSWQQWQRDHRLLQNASEFRRRFPLDRLLAHRDEQGRLLGNHYSRRSLYHSVLPLNLPSELVSKMAEVVPPRPRPVEETLFLGQKAVQRVIRSLDKHRS